jgi:hypothetical protein
MLTWLGVLVLLMAVPGGAATGAEETSPGELDQQTAPTPGKGVSAGPAKGCCGCCGGARGASEGKKPGCGNMRGAQGGGAGHRSEMRNAHTLIAAHESIERRVEDLPNGVRTVTTTRDPELLPVLREHVTEMAALIEGGGRIRNWDPLFATIFNHRDSIVMEIEEVENGVAVTETSDEPAVAALIRAHAVKVDEFVARGHAAYRESTPLPEDYSARIESPAARGIPCWTDSP